MGRRNSISALPADQQTAVTDCIRAHRHLTLDDMMVELKERELDLISRSALHRYLQKQEKADLLYANPDENTIITIVKRDTGEIRTLKSCASGLGIEKMIQKLNRLRPVS